MDRSILNKYKNQDEKLILSKVLDKISFCETRNQIQVTDFLDLAQQQLIIKFLKLQKQENYMLFGGYEEAERKVVIFYPEKLEELIREEKIDFNEWIKVIRITLPNENKGKILDRTVKYITKNESDDIINFLKNKYIGNGDEQ